MVSSVVSPSLKALRMPPSDSLSCMWLKFRAVLNASPLVWLLVAYLAIASCAVFGLGAWEAMRGGRDFDIRSRWGEYEHFRSGLYPHPGVEMPPRGTPERTSVYPPYAFPMMVPLFEPGGLRQAQYALLPLSAAALVAIGAWNARLLAPSGIAWAGVGAFAASAIFVNRSALNLGQFTIICMGLIALQMALLRRNRTTLAGICWALAMIKPHVALSFGALFLINRQWRGLVVGVAILTALSLGALWWTDVPVQKFTRRWASGMPMGFVSEAIGFGPGRIAEWTGLHRRTAVYACAGLLCVLSAAAALVMTRVRIRDPLVLAAACSVFGRLCFYHRPNDQIMLFPLMIACLFVAVQERSRMAVAVATAVSLSMWLPLGIQLAIPFGLVLQPIVWMLGASFVLAYSYRTRATQSTSLRG